ncbi:four helix bundle protein [bacterium]|nr:four helix bundle protein [bacterium]
MKTHKDLEVWKRSIELVTTVYRLTGGFPKEELFGISSQMRRAAISIPSNIAEGAARNHDKEFIHFLYIALGSISELETQTIICKNLNFMNDDNSLMLLDELTSLRKVVIGLIKSVKGDK